MKAISTFFILLISCSVFCQNGQTLQKSRFTNAYNFIENKQYQNALELLEMNIKEFPNNDGIDYSFAWACYCYGMLCHEEKYLEYYTIMRTKFCKVLIVKNHYRNWDEFLWRTVDSIKQCNSFSENIFHEVIKLDSISVRKKFPDYFGKTAFITKYDDKYSLILPLEMETAIKEYDENFQIFKKEDYHLPVFYQFSTFEAPFSIIGDFNGDKYFDLIVHGHNRGNELILAVLSNESRYEIIEIYNEKYLNTKQPFSYLKLKQRGEVDLGGNDVLNLETDALTIFDDKTTLIYYYIDNHFIKNGYSNWE